MPFNSDLASACAPPAGCARVLATSDVAAKTTALDPGVYYLTNLSTAWGFYTRAAAAATATDIVEYGVVSKGIPIAPGETKAIEFTTAEPSLFMDLSPGGTGIACLYQMER